MHDLVVQLIASLTLAQRQALKGIAEDLNVPASEMREYAEEFTRGRRHRALKFELGLSRAFFVVEPNHANAPLAAGNSQA
jgi:hypothetical protein